MLEHFLYTRRFLQIIILYHLAEPVFPFLLLKRLLFLNLIPRPGQKQKSFKTHKFCHFDDGLVSLILFENRSENWQKNRCSFQPTCYVLHGLIIEKTFALLNLIQFWLKLFRKHISKSQNQDLRRYRDKTSLTELATLIQVHKMLDL